MKHSIVTGGATGIGKAIARELAESGHRVLVVDSDQSALSEAIDQFRRDSLAAIGLELDLLSDSAVSTLNEALGGLEFEWLGLVNCASARLKRDVLSETHDSWAREIQLSGWVPFVLSRLVAALVRQRDISGSVVNLTSPLSHLVGGQSPAYHAGKAALESTTRYLAVHLPRTGARVTVNAVEPGLVVQDRHLDRFNSASSAAWRDLCESYLPRGEVGSDSDIAETVAWLLSPSARFVNGATIVVDGGGTIQDQLLTMKHYAERQE